MTDLSKGISNVTLVGKVKINDKSFSGEQVSDRTGYCYSQINLGIETAEGNVVYCDLMGGYSPSNPVIYAMNKEDNSSFQVNFADRLNPAIVDSVADFRLYKVGLEKDEKGKLIVKKFLSPMDVHDYLKEHLVKDMEIVVRGSFKFSEYNDNVQRGIEIQSIYLPFENKDPETQEVLPTEYKAQFRQTFLLDEDSFKKITKEDAEEGEVVVSAYAVDYVGKKGEKEVKKNMPFPQPITVKINKEKPDLTKAILNKIFKVKKGKVREVTIEGDIIEGYEKKEVSDEDIQLSDEIKELIEMGLYSEEEAKKKMTIRGNKVRKLVFTRPHIKKDKDNPEDNGSWKDDDKYKPEDLVVVIDDIEEDPVDIGEDMGDSEGDDSWMEDLGLK